MPTILSLNAGRAFDLNGLSVPAARATFHNAGTTTVRTVFSDPECEVPHPSPLIANGAGVFPPVFDTGGGDVSVTIADSDGVTLPGYPISPMIRVSTDITGADSVAFSPTAEIPANNVQDAIERVQQNTIEPLAAFGLGVTGNAGLLANIDATNIASGAYRFDGTTLGTFPVPVTKANGGTIRMWRQNASSALMTLTPNGTVDQHIRELSGEWSGWTRVVNRTDTANNATWAAGVSTSNFVVSPANIMAAIGAWAIGVNQKWQTPARAVGVAYTNNTGRPILISVTVDGSPGNPGVIDVRPNVGGVWVTASFGGLAGASLSAIIPDGHQYRVLGGDGLHWWAELR